jgi:hypothetical protein
MKKRGKERRILNKEEPRISGSRAFLPPLLLAGQ